MKRTVEIDLHDYPYSSEGHLKFVAEKCGVSLDEIGEWLFLASVEVNRSWAIEDLLFDLRSKPYDPLQQPCDEDDL